MIIEFIKPSYEIITPLDRDETLKTIERIGRTCYKSEDKITADSAARFVEMLIKRGHLSVIEHVNMTVRFITDRGVSHELVRHRLASYSQESTRYCNYKDKMVFVIPSWVKFFNSGLYEFYRGEYDGREFLFSKIGSPSLEAIEFIEACEQTALCYESLLSGGLRPEQARAILPNSLKTEIVMTANLREWMHVLKLRTSPAAHPDMRALMQPLRDEMQALLPEILGGKDE